MHTVELTRIAAALADVFFGRFARDDFVQHGFFVRSFAQNATETLDMFARRTGAGQDHGNGSFGNVHALVQDFGSCERQNLAFIERIQPLLAFFDLRFVRDGRN